MDLAVLVAVALFATVFASVIFGKELDEKEKQAIAKDKFQSSQPINKKEQDYEGSYFMEQDGFDSGNNTDGTNKRN
ncbi:hypothetical protein [Enterococcus casseliflavus]|uniref:Uncharacterized protein n=1 Tax=Enterococcus casseliflavus TaxID=37734 RepID=A0ABD5FI48_ENTCA|nr:hypothetical protein [Enterococcus casseliflavus]MDT2981778.1 hypothetical protein [Enterococcus casseliflavus]